jgi:hypothetical protein
MRGLCLKVNIALHFSIKLDGVGWLPSELVAFHFFPPLSFRKIWLLLRPCDGGSRLYAGVVPMWARSPDNRETQAVLIVP